MSKKIKRKLKVGIEQKLREGDENERRKERRRRERGPKTLRSISSV